jgi:flagellar hook-associated protein 3 FlgL
MRVTFNSTFAQSRRDIARASEQLAERQADVSSGKRVRRPSDDPTAAAGIVREEAALATTDQYTRSGDTASARLSLLDTVLSGMVSSLTTAQSTVLGARGSSATDATRAAAANTLAGIRDALFGDYNTQLGGSYLFAGTRTEAPPFTRDPAGAVSTYQGSADTAQVDVGSNSSVAVTVNGASIAAGSDGEDVFTTLDTLIAAIRTGDDAGIDSGTVKLRAAFDRAVAAQTVVGSHMTVLETQQGRLSDVRLSAKARLSKYRDANMADAITGMTKADTAYRAALGAAAQSGTTTLMDYLK